MDVLFSLGHGTLQPDAFVVTLRAAGVTAVADVRRFPASRRHPWFDAAALRGRLERESIAYRHCEALGGRRAAAPDSRNRGLRNTSFRGYADFMATAEFRSAFDALIATARERPVAMVCAETLWWRCHRRLIADAAVLLAGMEVRHLTPASRSSHVLTPGVRAVDGVLVYEAPPGR